MQCSQWPEGGIRSLGTGAVWVLGMNAGPLEEQSIFLTIEPPLWFLSLALLVSQGRVNTPSLSSAPPTLLATATAI